MAKQTNADKRLERQAAALRANLTKRKALSRARTETRTQTGAHTSAETTLAVASGDNPKGPSTAR